MMLLYSSNIQQLEHELKISIGLIFDYVRDPCKEAAIIADRN